MKALVILLLIVALTTSFLISVLPRPAAALDCDHLPWGWWNHPGLYTACMLVEQFWNCGFDWDCYGWDDGY